MDRDDYIHLINRAMFQFIKYHLMYQHLPNDTFRPSLPSDMTKDKFHFQLHDAMVKSRKKIDQAVLTLLTPENTTERAEAD